MELVVNVVLYPDGVFRLLVEFFFSFSCLFPISPLVMFSNFAVVINEFTVKLSYWFTLVTNVSLNSLVFTNDFPNWLLLNSIFSSRLPPWNVLDSLIRFKTFLCFWQFTPQPHLLILICSNGILLYWELLTLSFPGANFFNVLFLMSCKVLHKLILESITRNQQNVSMIFQIFQKSNLYL